MSKKCSANAETSSVKIMKTGKLSFRIHHPEHDLSSIGARLGVIPYRIWKRGEPKTTPKGRRLTGHREASYCAIRLQLEEESISETIREFLLKLEQHQEYFLQLSASGAKLEFYVTLSGESKLAEEFDWKLLARLANLHVSFQIEG